MHCDDQSLRELAERAGRELQTRGLWLACAESCTGGWLGKVLTDVPGSSAWFERGLVTYSDLAKRELLGVPEELLQRHGAVSPSVAVAMANGLLERAPVHCSVAVTGVAGPAGGTLEKPVGLVHIAWARRDGETQTRRYHFQGNREEVRRHSIASALRGLLDRVVADGGG